MQNYIAIRSLLGFVVTVLLAACGGGGSSGSSSSNSASAPTVTLTANAASVVSGSSVTLTWSSTDATSCMASGGWAGAKATSGSEPVGPLSVDASYILSCSGAGGSANQTASVAVTGPVSLHITSGAPPNGTVGVGYNHGDGTTCYYLNGHSGYCQPCHLAGTRPCPTGWVYRSSFEFRAAGGVPPYSWAAVGLPPGLRISADGTFIRNNNYCCRPLAAGTYSVVVTVTDAASPASQASETYAIVIAPPPPPTISAIPAPIAGAVNLPYYGATFHVASGGQAPFVWSETGAVPPGLVFNTDGTLSGTPTAIGTFPIAVMVHDALGQTSAPLDFTIPVLAHGFRATGGMGVWRLEHTATLLANGRVLVAGGRSVQTGLVTATAELFDPSDGSFVPTGSMTIARFGHTATLLANGKVLLTGGADDNERSASAELFDPATGTFASTGSMGTARLAHRALLLNDGTVLITGGNDAGFHSVASAELFDPAHGIFTPTGDMTTARDAHTVTLLNDGKVLVTGGTGGGPSLLTAELYDPANHAFVPSASMGTARSYHSATLLANGNVLVAGGWENGSIATATAELFDPATGSFTLTGNMETERAGQTATLLNDGTVLVTGGSGYGNLASAELFDPAAGSFSTAGSMGTERNGHAATLLNDGSVLITGQLPGATLLTAETYE